jgi:NADH:ubiquinone oxidoreductase subunit 5 (subunit L)/multisubunit Na+/H+ antiporter MnhA subunit
MEIRWSRWPGPPTPGGDDDLEVLRGVGRRAPWSGWGLAVGAVTLAGLPPAAGFVSEWFLLESLMQQFRVTALAGRLTLALAGAAVALTVGFAGVTFVRLVGMVVRVRRVPAWRSATMGVAGPDSYTAFGYANPTRRVLASVLHTQAEVVEVVETWLYRPVIRLFGAAVAYAKRLQSGRLDAYLLYMLIALVAVIAVVTALA